MKKASKKATEPIRLRMKPLSNGSQSLYLDIYRNGKREYEFLKLYIIPEKSAFDKMQNAETLKTANAIKAQRIIALQNEEHGFVVPGKSKINFLDYMELQTQHYKKKGSKGYALLVKSTISHLKKYKGDSVLLNQVDKAYLLGFIDYLNKTDGRNNIKLSESAKALYFNVVVIALNRAVKDELLLSNPAHKINHKDKPKAGDSTKVYLTLDEVKALASTECKYPQLKRAFMFACFCGLRYSDIKKLVWKQIHQITDDSFQVEIKQQKTGETLYLPLSENAMQWLPSKGEASDEANVFTLPTICTIEKYLPIWAKDAGIVNKHITFHVSRHTNATLMLYFGADIYTVSKLLGHTSVKTTQIYAKVVDENKRKAVNLIPSI